MHLFRQSLIFWLVCTQVRKADPVCQGGFVTPTAVLFQVEKDAGRVVSAVSAYWHLEGHFLNIYIFESRIYWSSRLIVHLFKLCKTADLALFAVALLSGFYSPATEAVGPKPFSWNGRVWDAKPCRLLHRFLRLIGWGLFWMWLGSGRYANVLLTVPGDGSCVAVSLTRPPLWRHYCLLIPKVLKKKKNWFWGSVRLCSVYSYVCVMTSRSTCSFLVVHIMTVNAIIRSHNSCEMWSAFAIGQYFFLGTWRDCCYCLLEKTIPSQQSVPLTCTKYGRMTDVWHGGAVVKDFLVCELHLRKCLQCLWQENKTHEVPLTKMFLISSILKKKSTKKIYINNSYSNLIYR